MVKKQVGGEARPLPDDVARALLAVRPGPQPDEGDRVVSRWVGTPKTWAEGTRVTQAVALSVTCVMYSRRSQDDLTTEDTFIVVRRGTVGARTRPDRAPLVPAVQAWFPRLRSEVAWEPVEIHRIRGRVSQATVDAWWPSLASGSFPQQLSTPTSFSPPPSPASPSITRGLWVPIVLVVLGAVLWELWVHPTPTAGRGYGADIYRFIIATCFVPLWLVLFCQLPFMRDPDAPPRSLDGVDAYSAPSSRELLYAATVVPPILVLLGVAFLTRESQEWLAQPLGSNLFTALVMLSMGAALAVVWAGLQAVTKRLRRARFTVSTVLGRPLLRAAKAVASHLKRL